MKCACDRSVRPIQVAKGAFEERRFPSAYAEAGLRYNSSIRRKISRNMSRDTATSANWNVTYRLWRPTLAPILTSFSRSFQRPMLCFLQSYLGLLGHG